MIFYSTYPYENLKTLANLPRKISLGDHLNGFDKSFNCQILDQLNSHAAENNFQYEITLYQIVTPLIKNKYPNIIFLSDLQTHDAYNFVPFSTYRIHPENSHDDFICSFNGSPHVGRKLLVSILHRFGWYNPDLTSKNFVFDVETIDGHLKDYLDPVQQQFYRKFFIGEGSENFFQTVNSFGFVQYDHAKNIYNLENKLTSSFLHIVSETLATSYYPFVTEKFLYSVVTRGLFLAYAQPGWHDHLEHFYGFRKYDQIFDYRFDMIQNPIHRLVELMSMISKFSTLSSDDWKNLYEMERDTIEHNYDHYFSKTYLKRLEKFC